LDLDFSNPFSFPPQENAGIVVLRLGRKALASQLFSLVERFVSALERQSPVGKLWIVDPTRIREYSPDDDLPDDGGGI
jgi:hypothetical protein